MLITFIALSTGMAIVVKRPLLDKLVLVLSAIPVALVANIARITLTGILHETAGGNVADHFYHDLAGWVMIPFALVLYWCVIWVFSHILVEVGGGPCAGRRTGGCTCAEQSAAAAQARGRSSSSIAEALTMIRPYGGLDHRSRVAIGYHAMSEETTSRGELSVPVPVPRALLEPLVRKWRGRTLDWPGGAACRHALNC